MTDSPRKLRLAELTAGEARDILPRNPVILLPMGSLEDQGPHAPMGDYLCAEKVAELIAARASAAGTETLMAPVVPFGGADYFGSMPGGIALSQPTLTAVISEIFGCLMRHGLSRFVVINGHGGNTRAIHDATHKIYMESGVIIPSYYLWSVGYTLLPGILGADRAKRTAGHGAEPLTSVAMHLFPELIRKDLVPPPPELGSVMGLKARTFASFDFQGAEFTLPVEYHEVSVNGVRGDPRECSSETGEKLVDKLVGIGADFVKHYAANAPKPKA